MAEQKNKIEKSLDDLLEIVIAIKDDMATKEELIAANSTIPEVCKFIGADGLFYGDLKDILESCLAGNPKIKDMESMKT